MKRRVIASLLTLVLCLTLLPAPAFAEEIGGTTPEPAATDIYVRSTGNDNTGTGSTDNPYATLAKAVDAADSGATIYVMSDLTMTKCARYYNKNLTITSYGETRTVTRGDDFETLSDTARSWYNPAMIEVQGNPEGAECGLTLKNIILDDTREYEGTVFAQAISGKSEEDKGNLVYVQDAMIASNATVPCTITLGEGAVLRNFGGMSAVRVTDQAKLVMKSGSKIEDTTVTDRIKGEAQDEVGPAGAIWVQGASVEMQAGSEIGGVVGRAVYVDGGTAEISGTISEIKGDAHMWQGKNGTAIHLRNNATGTLTATGLIENVTGGGTIVNLSGSTYTMDAGSVMSGNQGNNIAALGSANTIFMNGEITGIRSGNGNGNYDAINLQAASNATDLIYCKIGATGNIHDNNVWYGSVYVQGNNIELHHYGKINNNSSSDKSGGIVLANNFTGAKVFMYDGAEVIGNKSVNDGAGVMVSCGTFTMNGGKISGNIATGQAGGVYVRRGGQFIMNGGEISNNHANKYGGGVSFVASDWGYVPYVALNGGMISSNTMGDSDTKVSNDLGIASSDYSHINRYLYISDDVTIGNKAVYFETNSKIVTPADDSLDIKLGNASTDSNTALKNASTNDKGWANPLATFWVQRDGAAILTVGGLNPDKNLPVYVLTQKTGANGKPDSTAVNTYAAAVDADGNVSFTLPIADVNGNGCAVAIVRPTQDFGTLTISGPETIKQNKTNADYPVTYTVTYVMSENLKNIITQAGVDAKYNLAINQDTRLSGTPDSFDGNSIQVTYTLPNDAFVVGDSLFASAELTVTVGQSSYIIPSNVTETKLLGIDSFNVVFDWNDGSGKTETVSVIEGEALGDKMIADPTRSGYTFTGWNTQQDGKGSSFDKSTVITGSLTVYAQWSMNSSGGGSSKTYYYLAVEKVDAQDGHTLNGAKFGLYLDSKQIATATSNRSGIALFRIDESAYRKITAESELYYQELAAPDGYIMSGDKVGIEKSDLTTSQTNAELNAETVRNYRNTAPADLNSSDHVAYVHGYPDGTVKPNHQITRAEVAMMLYRLLADTRMAEIQTTFNSFSDVSPDEWYNEAVSTMTNGKYIAGYPDGTFGGNKSITRAEFVTMLVRFIGVQDEACSFSDVSKAHWAYDYIATATQAGWIAGYSDGSFKPEQAITRAEAMTIINRVLNRGVDKNSELLNFKVWPDNTISDWFYYEVIEATNEHEYTGSRPSEQWTSLVIH